MAQVFPTKANLMSTKKSLELAKLGYDLMDRKHNILVREMMQMVDSAEEIQREIDGAYSKAYEAMKKASVSLGTLNRFADLVPEETSVEIRLRSVMGVELPVVESETRDIDATFFGFENTDSSFDEACIYFNEVKKLTLKLAEIDNSICRLADAVRKTQKRSNALNNILIPRLEETVRNISDVLDEKEREEFSRLKVIKAKNNREN